MKKRWIILMTLIVIISLIGVLMPENPGLWEPDERMNTANVAWMIEICHHHPFTDHGIIRGTGTFLRLPDFHDPVLHLRILSAGPLDLASRRIPPSDGSSRFCRRYRGTCFLGSGGTGRCHLPGTPQRKASCPGQHPLCHSGGCHAVAGMVRIQCRVFPGCRRYCHQGFSEHQYGFGYGYADEGERELAEYHAEN